MRNERKQQAIWIGPDVRIGTVRNITEWEGRTVGVARIGDGAESVVQYITEYDRWDVLTGVHSWEIRGEGQ